MFPRVFCKDKFLFWLTLGAFLLRAAVLLYVVSGNPLGTDFFHFPDSANYLHPAHTLLAQGSLLDAYTNEPMTFRTPGYPVFLAGAFWLFGETPWVIALLQIVLITALIPLVYRAAAQFLPRAGARAAAALCALSAVLFAYAFAFLSDVLFAFFMTLFLYAALRFVKTERTAPLLAASCALTAGVFTRPVAYNLLFIGGVLLAAFTYKKGFKRALKTLAVFCLPVLLCTGAWQLRNQAEAGYAGFHSSAAYNLYFWNLDAKAAELGLTPKEGDRLLISALPEGFWQKPPSERDEWLLKAARPMLWKYLPYKIRHAPFWLAKTLLGGSFTQLSRIFFGRPPLTQEEFKYELNKKTPLPAKHLRAAEDYALLALCLLQTLLTAALALAGAVWLWRQKKERPAAAFLIVYVLYFWGISSTFFGAGGRYRAPFEPALCLLGGAGVQWLRSRFTVTRDKKSPG